jgi:aminopeptidase-like protein
MYYKINKYFDKLWPICRSITGNGLRASFHILQEIIPLQLHEISTGTSVLDWKIPNEWNIEEAFITDENGNKIIDFKKNNLHVVNYAIPIDKVISFEELLPHLYYKEELPDAIPYVTSYYKEKWGFCLSYRQFLELDKSAKYHVCIKSTLKPGSLTYGDLVIKGKSKKEILFTSYLCHPSMANNELSGPLTVAFLYNELSKRKNLKYTYRFVIAPETIGSIVYLDKNGDYLKENLLAGYVLTCCGDKGTISYKHSRRINSLADSWFKRTAKILNTNVRYYDFDPLGSDERQYCSPGYNLPVGSFMRTKYHEFKEYHTSLDNKSFISFEALNENIHFLNHLIDTIEKSSIYIRTNPYGEPNLGKRGLYDDLANKQNMPELLTMRMRLLNFCDGEKDIVSFSEVFGYNIELVNDELNRLKLANLIIEL